MAERCPTCLRPMRDDGEQHDDDVHCPASPRDHRLVRDDLACARIGIEVRDERLAAAKALNDRSRLRLIRLRDSIDLVIGETQQEPDECSMPESPTGSAAPCSSESATAAGIGGQSEPTTSAIAVASTVGPASADSASSSALVIDGWVCDDANQFGHRVCRAVRAPGSGFTAALVLTVGEEDDEGPLDIAVPARVLGWLLTGEPKETA